jgi:hypothetical protein
MYAERVVLNTDSAGHLVHLPMLPANKRVEAIFLVIDDSSDMNQSKSLSADQRETIAFSNHSTSNIQEWLSPEEDAIWN